MKKLLSLLGATALMGGAAATVVSCGDDNKVEETAKTPQELLVSSVKTVIEGKTFATEAEATTAAEKAITDLKNDKIVKDSADAKEGLVGYSLITAKVEAETKEEAATEAYTMTISIKLAEAKDAGFVWGNADESNVLKFNVGEGTTTPEVKKITQEMIDTALEGLAESYETPELAITAIEGLTLDGAKITGKVKETTKELVPTEFTITITPEENYTFADGVEGTFDHTIQIGTTA